VPIWSIKIVPSTSGIAGQPVAFVPDLPNASPGDPLNVLSGDLVSWNNTTNDVIQPWPTSGPDQNFTPQSDQQVGPSGSANYLADPIPANASSRPSWSAVASPVTANTIYYCAKAYPNVRGTIVITG
jgi:hypothetical protein